MPVFVVEQELYIPVFAALTRARPFSVPVFNVDSIYAVASLQATSAEATSKLLDLQAQLMASEQRVLEKERLLSQASGSQEEPVSATVPTIDAAGSVDSTIAASQDPSSSAPDESERVTIAELESALHDAQSALATANANIHRLEAELAEALSAHSDVSAEKSTDSTASLQSQEALQAKVAQLTKLLSAANDELDVQYSAAETAKEEAQVEVKAIKDALALANADIAALKAQLTAVEDGAWVSHSQLEDAHAQVCVCVSVRAYVCVHVRTCLYACVRACARVCMRVCVRVFV
jgi:chromosome segregation ATPase